MKVALCLSGHFRSFESCYANLKSNLIDVYNPDIFIMAWIDNFGYHIHPTETTNPKTHPGFAIDSPPVPSSYVQEMLKLLNPLDIHLDHYYLHDANFQMMLNQLEAYHHPWEHHRPKGTLSLNFTRKIVMTMKQRQEQMQGYRYDRVICTRWDIDHAARINLESHDPNVITLPNVHGPDVTSDVWAAGPSHLLDAWAEQFNCIDELVKINQFSLGTHEWMKSWFSYKQIPWQNRDDLGVYTRR